MTFFNSFKNIEQLTYFGLDEKYLKAIKAKSIKTIFILKIIWVFIFYINILFYILICVQKINKITRNAEKNALT